MLESECGPSVFQTRQYELPGQFLDAPPEAGEVLTKHEDIDRFMRGHSLGG